MTRIRFAFLLLFVAACSQKDASQPDPQGNPGSAQQPHAVLPPGGSPSLADARKGFKTKLVRREKANEPVEEPPAKLFRTVRYDSPAGKLAAYLTPDPKNGKKNPAIIWITGGDCNTIGDAAWLPADPKDDQSARQYREAGIVMMFPSLRGGNENPGFREGYLGEVDDVLAAADFLAKQDYVDPNRIYLGGHSTGGTLVLLVAECSDRFRAVFSFGPVGDVSGYPPQFRPPVDPESQQEIVLRSPRRWLQAIQSPTFVFEGAGGNIESLWDMKEAPHAPQAHFYPVNGTDHFGILAPTNRLIAQKILKDDGPAANITFTEAELNRLFGK